MKTNMFWFAIYTILLIANLTSPDDYGLNFSFLTDTVLRIVHGGQTLQAESQQQMDKIDEYYTQRNTKKPLRHQN